MLLLMKSTKNKGHVPCFNSWWAVDPENDPQWCPSGLIQASFRWPFRASPTLLSKCPRWTVSYLYNVLGLLPDSFSKHGAGSSSFSLNEREHFLCWTGATELGFWLCSICMGACLTFKQNLNNSNNFFFTIPLVLLLDISNLISSEKNQQKNHSLFSDSE